MACAHVPGAAMRTMPALLAVLVLYCMLAVALPARTADAAAFPAASETAGETAARPVAGSELPEEAPGPGQAAPVGQSGPAGTAGLTGPAGRAGPLPEPRGAALPFTPGAVLLAVAGVALFIWLALRLRTARRKLQRAEHTLSGIVQATTPLVEEDFFRMLVQQLSDILGFRFALAGELRDDGNNLRILALWLGDGHGETFEYPLRATPCARVLNAPDLVFLADGVSEMFPEAALPSSLDIRSYMGIGLRDVSGNPLGLLAVMHDLPLDEPPDEHAALLRLFAGRATAELERMRSGRSLRASEAHYRSLFENNHVVALLIDPATGAIRDASPAAAEFYGWPRDTMRAMHIGDINTLSPESLGNELVSASRGDRQRFRFRHRLADGSVRDVESNTGALMLHGEALLYSIIIDVTEQRLAAEAQQRSEHRLRMLVENAGDAIYLADGKGRIREANAEAEHQTGYTREQLVRLTLFDLDERLDPAAFRRMHRDLAAQRKITFETRHRSPNGCSLPVEVRMALVEDAGEDSMLLAIVRDCSSRKQAEREMQEAKNAAEAANRTKSEFLANMSHEIRTPLNGILAMLQLLQADPAKSMRKVYVNAAIQSCRRLGMLLGDILDLSRVEAGKLELHDAPFELRAVLDEVRALFEGPAAEHTLALRLVVDERIPRYLCGDAMRLRQVLFNLVGNAVKFTERGVVELEAWRVRASRTRGCRVLFSVRDTGVGISKELLESVFDSFVQGDTGVTRRHQGAGLGLPIVRRLVRLMRGTITVDSEPGLGSTFSVCLPFRFASATEISRDAHAATAPDALRGMRILLGEDDTVNRLAVSRLLEGMGALVTSAGNGEQVLAALRASDFDCVLMDIQMPVMDGMEATRRLRALGCAPDVMPDVAPDEAPDATPGMASGVAPLMPQDGQANAAQAETTPPPDNATLRARAATPVIALTAHAMQGDREHALGAGMDGYIMKPVDAATLASVITTVLRERGLRECDPEERQPTE